MEKVSKLFDEIDDDLKPYDGEIDLNDLQDADKVAEKPPSKLKSDISDAKSSNNMSKMISKSRKKSKKQMNFNFNEKPTLNEDVGFALLGKRRNMEVIDLEHDSISEERRSNSSKHESEAVVNIFKIKDLKAIVSSCKENEIILKHPEFDYETPLLSEQKLEVKCLCCSEFNQFKTENVVTNCLICQGKEKLANGELVKVIIQSLEEYEYEDSLTQDWVINQLQHVFRLKQTLELKFVLTQIYLRYINEMDRGNLRELVLLRCLVRDEPISKCMNLWIIDIQHCNEEMSIVRLSDYFYSINIVLKPKNYSDDEYLLLKIHDGSFKLGTKIKCQNIIPCDIPIENAQEYANPIVNAQSHDTFKLCYNSCVVIDKGDRIGECEAPLYKSLYWIEQQGGATCNIKATVVEVLPIFYFGIKSSYTRDTYEFLQSDIYSKIQEEAQSFEENMLLKEDINIQKIEEKVKEENKFDAVRISFGVFLKDFQASEEEVEIMLLIISDWSEERTSEIKSGDVLNLNYLIPDDFGAKFYPYHLVFKAGRNSNLTKVELTDDSEDIDGIEVFEYYPKFRSNITTFHKNTDNRFEYPLSKFVNVSGVVVKIFECAEPRNSAKEKELRSFIMITSCLTIVSVNIHSNSFIFSRFVKEGDVIYIQNLCYEASSQFDEETHESVLLNNNFDNEDESKDTIDQFHSCNFTTIKKNSREDMISQDLDDLNDLVDDYKNHLKTGKYQQRARYNSRRKSSRKGSSRRSKISPPRLENPSDTKYFNKLVIICEKMLDCKITAFNEEERKSMRSSRSSRSSRIR
ncbi:unnamed protein product [Moneuplotes crassus]|uniref:Uncharacterized protein n=1 Tax=Euplotes crassus TaxID=5936 RepID=A0AAD2D1P0_EUPCR|nr:unnamed protein product [Moneuplotes crassus]